MQSNHTKRIQRPRFEAVNESKLNKQSSGAVRSPKLGGFTRKTIKKQGSERRALIVRNFKKGASLNKRILTKRSEMNTTYTSNSASKFWHDGTSVELYDETISVQSEPLNYSTELATTLAGTNCFLENSDMKFALGVEFGYPIKSEVVFGRARTQSFEEPHIDFERDIVVAQDIAPNFEIVSDVEEKSDCSAHSDLFDNFSEDSLNKKFTEMTIKPAVVLNPFNNQNAKVPTGPLPNFTFLGFGERLKSGIERPVMTQKMNYIHDSAFKNRLVAALT